MIISGKHQETEILFLVEEADEGGYIARSLAYPIYTQADSLDELREMVRDAVLCHFGDEHYPALIRLHIVNDEVLAV
nr:hypothetical protein [uncultured Methanospirillum sp.]